MNKHLLFMALTATAYGTMLAGAVNSADIIEGDGIGCFNEVAKCMVPSYIENAVVPSWKDNWYLNVQGGTSAFLGSPLGCGDVFDRVMPALQISVGKWHTPTIGNRLVFQGFEWKASDFHPQKIRIYRADFMLNLMPMIGFGNGNCNWDIIPYVGLGLIDNRTACCSPFAVSYGLQGRFKVAESFHITAEIGNATTFKNADGYGCHRQLGDNLLTLSAGVSWTFGRQAGFKRIVDAKPYMAQNERLMAFANALRERNDQLLRANESNTNVIAELRKILSIEGLLEKHIKAFTGQYEVSKAFPMNDYSGLNSLRDRLRKCCASKDSLDNAKNICSDMDSENKVTECDDISKRNDNAAYNAVKQSSENDEKDAAVLESAHDFDMTFARDCYARIIEDSECVGAPIFFFFKLGSSQLTDMSQLANLDEIARIAKKYGLIAKIEGAADAGTGTEAINSNLGAKRSQYIANCLIERGVIPDKCIGVSVGGISKYSPDESNRNAIVRLYLP